MARAAVHPLESSVANNDPRILSVFCFFHFAGFLRLLPFLQREHVVKTSVELPKQKVRSLLCHPVPADRDLWLLREGSEFLRKAKRQEGTEVSEAEKYS